MDTRSFSFYSVIIVVVVVVVIIIIIIIIVIIIIIIIINHRVNSQCPIRYGQFLPAQELSGR